jgi:hypothetical protein
MCTALTKFRLTLTVAVTELLSRYVADYCTETGHGKSAAWIAMILRRALSFQHPEVADAIGPRLISSTPTP